MHPHPPQVLSKGVALVTGAAQGIGRGIALRLARDGFDVVVNDLSEYQDRLESLVKEIQQVGREAIIAIADVSQEKEVQDMVELAVKELGGLDVMVANAGICIAKPVANTTVEEWDKLFSINARGTFLSYKYAALQMIAQGRGGRIIGASSIAGKSGEAGFCGYSATKFAIRGLTHSAAQEWGRYGITVNTYCPGSVETRLVEILANQVGVSADHLRNQSKAGSPLGKMGTPEDVANVVSFLAAEESAWITGQSFSVNGGRHYD